MSQKVTTSDTKQYTYDRIRLAYGDIGSLKDKDGNEMVSYINSFCTLDDLGAEIVSLHR